MCSLGICFEREDNASHFLYACLCFSQFSVLGVPSGLFLLRDIVKISKFKGERKSEKEAVMHFHNSISFVEISVHISVLILY